MRTWDTTFRPSNFGFMLNLVKTVSPNLLKIVLYQKWPAIQYLCPIAHKVGLRHLSAISFAGFLFFFLPCPQSVCLLAEWRREIEGGAWNFVVVMHRVWDEKAAVWGVQGNRSLSSSCSVVVFWSCTVGRAANLAIIAFYDWAQWWREESSCWAGFSGQSSSLVGEYSPLSFFFFVYGSWVGETCPCRFRGTIFFIS